MSRITKYIKNFSNPRLTSGNMYNIAYIMQSRPNHKYQVINNYDESDNILYHTYEIDHGGLKLESKKYGKYNIPNQELVKCFYEFDNIESNHIFYLGKSIDKSNFKLIFKD